MENTPFEDINVNLPILRGRNRDLFMSGGLGTGAIKLLSTDVVGSGLKLKVVLDNEALGITEEQATNWARDVEKRFAIWANSKDCCISGLNNFYELQRLSYLASLINGDSIILITYNEYNELTLNVIESDRVSTPMNLKTYGYGDAFSGIKRLENGNYIESGIEKTPKGKVVAIYVQSDENGKTEWSRHEVRNKVSGLPNVLINFTPERPNQTRGVPFLSSAITTLKQMEEYIEADLESTIINSKIGVIFHLDDELDNPFSATGSSLNEDDVETFGQKKNRVKKYKIDTGAVLTLGKEDKVTFADPNKPKMSFESFITTLTKVIGSTLEIPAEVLIKSFNSNYSASRASLNSHWQVVKNKRMNFISDFCQPIYEIWLFQQISTGVIKAPKYLDSKYYAKLWSGAEWIGSSLSSIDPLKEVSAAAMRVENGFSTRSKEAMEMTGTDFFVNAKIRKREEEELKALQLKGGEENEQRQEQEQNREQESDDTN